MKKADTSYLMDMTSSKAQDAPSYYSVTHEEELEAPFTVDQLQKILKSDAGKR